MVIAKYLPLIVICSAGTLFLNSPVSHSDEEKSGGVQVVAIPATPPDNAAVPPPEQEEKYVREVREWLDTLPKTQQARARQILREAHEELTDLRAAIRDKKTQLATLSFDRGTSPETLPRLGLELQVLRDALAARLEVLKRKLAAEASIDMGRLRRDSFWLPLPPEKLTN